MENPKPKRDFIFIDESGDLGMAADYYVLGLLHLTDVSLREVNIHLGALRYFGGIKKELKSTKLNPLRKDQIAEILEYLVSHSIFIRASAVYVSKKEYQGPYWADQHALDHARFRNHILRKLLEYHFKDHKPQSSEIELVIDRFYTGEREEQQLKNYLRMDREKLLPAFDFILQADSRYIELLQIADWVAGTVKERYFTHPEREHPGLELIKVMQVIG
jgi:hypothetical protein